MMEKARSHPDLVGEYVDQLMECLDNGGEQTLNSFHYYDYNLVSLYFQRE